MARSTLTNRSARLCSPSATGGAPGGAANGKNPTIAKLVSLRRPHDGSSKNFRASYGGGGDDDTSVKSNTGLPLPTHRYVLPCLRFRSRKSVAMAVLATSAIFVSLSTMFLAYRSLSSMSLLSPSPHHFFLPPARKWGAGRERRREARRGRRRAHSPPPATETDVNSVEYSEYEAYLLNYLFSLRAEGIKWSVLPLNRREPEGQDMGIYASLGCSVFNQLNDDKDRASSAAFRKDRIKKIWTSHMSSILAASRHADDATYSHRNWTATLLKSLSPYSILDHLSEGRSVEDGAIGAENVERIVGIIARRFLGLLQYGGRAPPENVPPPLRIAVFGGPTVEGKGCHRARVDIPRGSILANPAFCAFPYRLERFLNALLLPPAVLAQLRRTLGETGPVHGGATANEEVRLVEVINLGEEGTDPEYAAVIVRNRMFPPLSNAQSSSSSGYGGGPPDLVIDAYGVDDFGKESGDFDFLDEMSQSPSDLPAQCSKANRKPPPVIVRAVLEEDAIFKQQRLESLMLTAVLGEAVDDAEEGEMSLPDVQDLEGKETVVSGAFGMAGHVASSWALAFNLAYAAIGHCGSVVGIRQRPRVPMIRNANEALSTLCDNGIDPPCTFSFLAGLKGTAPRPSTIAYSLMHFIVENTGWQPESDISTGFARKTGLVGTGSGATLTLLFRNVTRPVRRLDVVTLRSTSEAWSDGTARFVVVTGGDFSHGSKAAEESAKVAKETSFEVSADLIADQSNGEDRHISYHFGVDLTEGENVGQVGTDVMLRIILTKGNRFKVLGLMLCE